MPLHRLSLEHIEEASRLIDPAFLHSPQFEAESIGRRMGVQVFVKVETVNPIRSFKGRGADYFVAKLPSDVRRLVCASAGNFGQGLAFAARKRGIILDVFASEHANPLKLDAIRRFGAHVHIHGHDFDAAKAEGRAYGKSENIAFVEDGKEPEISEGAGTIGAELCALSEPLDALFIPLGNGALIGGVARWMKHASPATKIFGVCAATANAMEQSWARGTVVETATASTAADGIAVRVPVPEAVEDTLTLVDHIVQVGERAMIRAMRLAFHELGLLLEPSGAVALAGLKLVAPAFEGRRVGIIFTGANISDQHRRLLSIS